MIAWVSWEEHASSANYRGAKVDRKSGEGALVGFVMDGEGHPSGVVVVDGELKTVRLTELKFGRWDER